MKDVVFGVAIGLILMAVTVRVLTAYIVIPPPSHEHRLWAKGCEGYSPDEVLFANEEDEFPKCSVIEGIEP